MPTHNHPAQQQQQGMHAGLQLVQEDIRLSACLGVEGAGVARLGLLPREQHVVGGEVAVDDALGVQVRQRLRNLLQRIEAGET